MQPIKELFVDENGLKRRIKCIRYTTIPGVRTNAPRQYHYHECLEIIYIKSGNSTVIVNDKEYFLSTGELIIIPPNFNHVAAFRSPTEFIVVMCTPEELYFTESTPYESKHIKNFLNSDAPYIFNIYDIDGVGLDNLFVKISDEFFTKQYMNEIFLRLHITQLIATFMRFHSKSKNNDFDKSDIPEMINEIISYIKENYDTVTAEEIALKFGISYNYFSYLFKKHTNMRFIEYLTKVKLTEAKKNLVTTNKSITEIANDIGFSTSSHFIMLFKKYNGISPNKFRTYYTQVDRM